MGLREPAIGCVEASVAPATNSRVMSRESYTNNQKNIITMKLTKVRCSVGGVLLASVLLFGFRGTIHRLTAGITQAREFINENTPVEHLLSVAKKQIQDAEERLFDAESASDGHRQQEKRVLAEIARFQQASNEARGRLEILRPALASNGGFQQTGCHYTAADVNQDALTLVSFVKNCDAQVELRQGQIKELRQALSSGDSVLADARNAFSEAKTRFTELEMRLKQQQAVADATSAARAAKDRLASDLDNDFASTVNALEKRLNKLQRQNDSIRTTAGGVPTGNIPFNPASGRDAKALVDEVLGKGKAEGTTALVQ